MVQKKIAKSSRKLFAPCHSLKPFIELEKHSKQMIHKHHSFFLVALPPNYLEIISHLFANMLVHPQAFIV